MFLLVVKPEMDMTPSRSKAATNTGDTARLTCKANAVPRATFKWSREGAAISVNTTKKYYIEFHDVSIKNKLFRGVISARWHNMNFFPD